MKITNEGGVCASFHAWPSCVETINPCISAMSGRSTSGGGGGVYAFSLRGPLISLRESVPFLLCLFACMDVVLCVFAA